MQKIFSVFITKEQHLTQCVKPRLQAYRINPQQSIQQNTVNRQQCILSPCECKIYETFFTSLYGLNNYNNALSYLQGKCSQWCKSGKQPTGIINEATATHAINKNSARLLAMYGKLLPFLMDFVKYGKILGEYLEKGFDDLKKGAVVVGKDIIKGAKFVGTEAKVVGKDIAKGAKVVGKAFSTAARKIGNGFRSVGRKIGNGFRSVGRRIGNFFRRRW